MQRGKTRRYTLGDICSYPFDLTINMIPFLPNCEIPRYDKYNDKTDPQDHVGDFFIESRICTNET